MWAERRVPVLMGKATLVTDSRPPDWEKPPEKCHEVMEKRAR